MVWYLYVNDSQALATLAYMLEVGVQNFTKYLYSNLLRVTLKNYEKAIIKYQGMKSLSLIYKCCESQAYMKYSSRKARSTRTWVTCMAIHSHGDGVMVAPQRAERRKYSLGWPCSNRKITPMSTLLRQHHTTTQNLFRLEPGSMMSHSRKASVSPHNMISSCHRRSSTSHHLCIVARSRLPCLPSLSG
jgi:hypothetical protein